MSHITGSQRLMSHITGSQRLMSRITVSQRLMSHITVSLLVLVHVSHLELSMCLCGLCVCWEGCRVIMAVQTAECDSPKIGRLIVRVSE